MFRAIVSDGEDSATEITMDRDHRRRSVLHPGSGFHRCGGVCGVSPRGRIEDAHRHGDGLGRALDQWWCPSASTVLPSAPEVHSLTTEADTGCFGVDLFTTDALYACITTHSTDPDGDPVTYAYEWYRDGFLVEGLDGPRCLRDGDGARRGLARGRHAVGHAE